jgi:hypothetical protein
MRRWRVKRFEKDAQIPLRLSTAVLDAGKQTANPELFSEMRLQASERRREHDLRERQRKEESA